jgi:prevent-host-death family protein
MIQETPAVTAQRDFSQLLNKVQYQHEQFIITDAGKPVAALVDMLLFEKIARLAVTENKVDATEKAAAKMVALRDWLATLPNVPPVPLQALDREELYR